MKRLLPLLLAGAALAASANAQIGSVQRPSATLALVGFTDVNGEKRLPDFSKDKYVDAETGATLEPSSKVREGMKVKNQAGEVFVVHVPERFLSLGVYFASFGIAGPIQQDDDSFEGGTSNSNNPLLSLDAGLPILPRKYGTLGVGGWYFFSPKGQVDDVYQVHLRYGFKNQNPFGLQVAYLNARRPESYGMTYHVTYTLNSLRFAPSQNPWNVEFGAGGFNDLSREPLVTGGSRKRNTLTPSFYVNASWTILPRTSMLATLWTLRDRNIDLTRYCLGLSYRF